MDGGIVRGRVSSRPRPRRSRIHLVAIPSALVAMVVAGVVIASLGVDRPDDQRSVGPPTASQPAPSDPVGASPGATQGPLATPTSEPLASTPPADPTAAPSPAPNMESLPPEIVVSPDATPIAGLIDPFQLPRYPGSDVVGMEEGIDGAVSWTLIEYIAAAASQDEVREHYRTVFRDTAWLVGDVDFADGVWSFAANQGDREAQLEISVDEDDIVRVSAYITDVVAAETPSLTPRATPQREREVRRDRDRPRVNRQRPAPDRDRPAPRYRGGGDDDDDDDD